MRLTDYPQSCEVVIGFDDLWKAYREGARDARENPRVTNEEIECACDAYVKLVAPTLPRLASSADAAPVRVLWCEECADLADAGCLTTHGPNGGVGHRDAIPVSCDAAPGAEREERPSWEQARRASMAPRNSEERQRMLWAFREGCERMRTMLRVCGFEVQAIMGVLGDEGMAQRCVPRLPAPAPTEGSSTDV